MQRHHKLQRHVDVDSGLYAWQLANSCDIDVGLLIALQWAKIILIIEQTLSTEARRHQQQRYSQPMRDQRRALPIRWDRRQGTVTFNIL